MPTASKKKDKKYPVKTFRMKDEVYAVLENIAVHENRGIGNMLEELILRNKVGGDDRVRAK